MHPKDELSADLAAVQKSEGDRTANHAGLVEAKKQQVATLWREPMQN